MALRLVPSTALFCAIGMWLGSALPAAAAVCDRGHAAVPKTPLGDHYCSCFDKDPPGTQVFVFDGLSLSVTTPSQTFQRPYPYDAMVTCDADHLYITERESDGAPLEKHSYPLRETSVSLGGIGEVPVVPKDQPSLIYIRLVLLGHARYVTTI